MDWSEYIKIYTIIQDNIGIYRNIYIYMNIYIYICVFVSIFIYVCASGQYQQASD